jgi:hypothetical protein
MPKWSIDFHQVAAANYRRHFRVRNSHFISNTFHYRPGGVASRNKT